MLKKLFGIISYIPDPDTEYHRYIRNKRTAKCSALLSKIGQLWSDIDILIIAQNWKDYEYPEIPNHIKVVRSEIKRLGITSARRVLRQEFLESDYDYLIMLDDDVDFSCSDPKLFLSIIDAHPNGIGIADSVSSPTNFLAISKTIYAQVDLPNIDRESGQGFENLVFAANCKAMFQNETFNFPKSCISEIPDDIMDKCPSTWSSEQVYDWDYMIRVTDALIESATDVSNVAMSEESKIDIILPFVNPYDQNWLSDLHNANTVQDIFSTRFRSWDTLKYILRGIELYMPFVRNVILLAAYESQIPSWLNTSQVRIVFHRDFIPAEYLPTFNSCTIETFLCNITDISEKIIYFNDDIFPINEMSITDFFTDSTPHIKYLEHEYCNKSYTFDSQCRLGMDIVTDMLKIPNYPQGEMVHPGHTAFPILKSTLQIFKDNLDRLYPYITQFREANNVNQYIYHYYQYFLGNYINSASKFIYLETRFDMENVADLVLGKDFKLLCLNDGQGVSDFDKKKQDIISMFEKKFPNKSKYEI